MPPYSDRYWNSPDGLRLHYRHYEGPLDRLEGPQRQALINHPTGTTSRYRTRQPTGTISRGRASQASGRPA